MANPTPTQIFPAPADSDPPTIRCKKCKVPLPDATWKNCDNCRRHRTESYNRWKKSVEARNIAATSGSSLPSEAQSSSAPAPRRDSTDVAPDRAYYKTSSQASTPSVTHQFPSARDNNGPETAASRTNATTNQPRMTSTSAVPPESIHVPEFQWSDELVDHLLELPPRSTFLGKFSVIADPMVSNGSRAYMFIDQLRARGLSISNNAKSTPRIGSNPTNAYPVVLSCKCQAACNGRVVISVDDNVSHPHGVHGQRVGIAILHS